MQDGPLVSIITVCYNSEQTIKETIKSVLRQTYLNVEYILVDGASKDNTVDIIKSYEDKFKKEGIKYKWISEPDDGIYDAMNKGSIMASGDYVYYIGADDVIIKDGLYNIMKELDGKVMNELIVLPVKSEAKKSLSYPVLGKRVNIIHHQGAIFNKENLDNFGLYNKRYKIHADFNLITKYTQKFGVELIDIPLCKFSRGGVSINGKNMVYSIKELFEIYLKYNGEIISLEFIKLLLRPFYYYLESFWRKT